MYYDFLLSQKTFLIRNVAFVQNGKIDFPKKEKCLKLKCRTAFLIDNQYFIKLNFCNMKKKSTLINFYPNFA